MKRGAKKSRRVRSLERQPPHKHVLACETIMREGNIGVVLDSYDDLFSDFDPRPYSVKALSDDFLNECRKASADKTIDEKALELRLFVPSRERNKKHEANISKRLKAHFSRHYDLELKALTHMKNEGYWMFALGVILTFISTYVYGHPNTFDNFLFVLINPAGWFILWTGLDKILIESKHKKPDLEFYKKMSNARIYFHGY
jgi:hypothetical protein